MIHTIDLEFQISHAIASFVVPTDEGPVVIETGPHSVFPHLEAELQRLGYQVSDVKHVLLSHIHFDHAGAAWAFAKAGARVYVHPVGYKHLLDPSRLYGSAKRIYGDMMEKLWGLMEGIPENQLIAVEDQTELNIGGVDFKAWHTPGHANHHIAWQMGEVVFTGDVAGCKIDQGPVVPPCPPPDINIEKWLHSIQILRNLNPKALYLTHFGQVDDVSQHLDDLETILWDWANWIKPHFEAGKDPQSVTPAFQAYTDQQLYDAGLDEAGVRRYSAANPAWMSVAGLFRYWKKRTEKSEQ